MVVQQDYSKWSVVGFVLRPTRANTITPRYPMINMTIICTFRNSHYSQQLKLIKRNNKARECLFKVNESIFVCKRTMKSSQGNLRYIPINVKKRRNTA